MSLQEDRPHHVLDLQGSHVVVTAGGTREPIEPIRFIGNRSSGKMGFALADAARVQYRANRRHVSVLAFSTLNVQELALGAQPMIGCRSTLTGLVDFVGSPFDPVVARELVMFQKWT